MRPFRKSLTILLAVLLIFSCTACSWLDTLTDNLKGGVEQLGDNVAIGRSSALITPYQSFDGKRTSDNTAFTATYSADVSGFNGQDILVGNTGLKGSKYREITIHYEFDIVTGQCQLIYIDPKL